MRPMPFRLLISGCALLLLCPAAAGATYKTELILDARSSAGSQAGFWMPKISNVGYATALLYSSRTEARQTYACLWRAGSVAYLALPSDGGVDSRLFGPTERGDVVIENCGKGTLTSVWIWHCAQASGRGKVAKIGSGDSRPRVSAVSARGTVTGNCDRNGRAMPFIIENDQFAVIPYDELRLAAHSFDINDRGDLVGELTHRCNPGGKTTNEAFLWRGGEFQLLGMLDGCERSSAMLVNNAGQTVINSTTIREPLDYHWSLWADGAHQKVILPDDVRFSKICGLNDSGQVLGYYTDSRGIHGFVWAKGKLTLLTTAQGRPIEPAAINNKGQIVGNQGGHAYLWENGAARALPSPESSSVSAADINDSGVVVGTLSDDQYVVMWRPSTEVGK